jgi:serine/threonine protein kinase
LLLSNHENNADVVITDFGLSAIKRPGAVINRAVGTPGYLAPEVLIALDTGKGYGEEVDMFGVGVITYILYVVL